ncbi:TRAP transporter substrate-binding protein DctP [Paracoccus sp. (in: a-proteobacteria)]|uniref:TRAP transporter substrate-binding protein DctP n=1 Tax=Paracoccus sp. TaxID=267 RepID=UPI003A8BC103
MKTIAALTLTLGLGLPASGQAAETILFNCFFPPRHYVCSDFLPEMARRIDEATEGRVRMRIPPKSLAAPPEQYQGVVNGVMDGAVQFNGFLAADIPAVAMGLLPFVGHKESLPAGVALWETHRQHFGDQPFGEAILLSTFAFNGADIFSVNATPITTPEDLSSRKIWAVPGGPADIMAAAGASVVSGPAVQMLELVSKGVVDGYVGQPLTEVTQYKLTDYTKSVTLFDDKILQPGFSFYVGKQKWDRIAPVDQAAIQQALGLDFVRYMGRYQDEVFEKSRQELADAGVVFVDGPPELLAKLKGYGALSVENWVAAMAEQGVDGRAALADFEAHYQKARAEGGR